MKKIFGLLFSLGCISNMYGQINLTNTGTLYISNSSDILYVNGNFTNNSSSALTNKGQLYVRQNLTNNQAAMAAGTGTLYLNGTSLQTLAGAAPFKTFNFVSNNSGGILLNADLSISGTHTFTLGVINSSATPNYLVYEAGSGYAGAADNRHVAGWIKKYGATSFTFPTGNGAFLRPIGLTNLSANSEFNVSFAGVTPNRSNLQAPIASVNFNEHWNVNKISGGTAQVQMNWDNSKIGFNKYIVADIRTAVYSAALWTNAGGSATGSVATTGSITSNALNTFGKMTLGSISFVIPVKFLRISAAMQGSIGKVTWQTASEINVDYYDVQRSEDGTSFTNVGRSKAKNADLQTYSYDDTNVPQGIVYYRVRSVDFDGTIKYSTIVSLRTNKIAEQLVLLTNPVTDHIGIAAHNYKSSAYSYQLLNAAGQSCRTGSFTCDGNSVISIPVNNLSPGQYSLAVFRPGERVIFKLLVQQ